MFCYYVTYIFLMEDGDIDIYPQRFKKFPLEERIVSIGDRLMIENRAKDYSWFVCKLWDYYK